MSKIRDQIISRLTEKKQPSTEHTGAKQVKGEVGGKVKKALSSNAKELSAPVLMSYIRGITDQYRLSETDPSEAIVFIYKKLLEENVSISRDLVPILKNMFGIGGGRQFSLLSRAQAEYSAEATIRKENMEHPSKAGEPVMQEKKRSSIKEQEPHPSKEQNETIGESEKERIEKLRIIKAFKRKILSKISNDEQALRRAGKEKIPRKLKKKNISISQPEDKKADETLIVRRSSKPSIKEIDLRVYDKFASELESKAEYMKSKLEKVKDQDSKKRLETTLTKQMQKMRLMKSQFKPLKDIKDKLRKISVEISKSI